MPKSGNSISSASLSKHRESGKTACPFLIGDVKYPGFLMTIVSAAALIPIRDDRKMLNRRCFILISAMSAQFSEFFCARQIYYAIVRGGMFG